MMVNMSSAFALFIGMFIVYNSFATAVTQRRSEIGVLRALGATRGQIRWLFLGESALMGLVGSVVGCAFGVVIAGVVAARSARSLGDVYGVARQAIDIATQPDRPRVRDRHRRHDQPGRRHDSRAERRSGGSGATRCKKGGYQECPPREGRLRAILAAALAASWPCVCLCRHARGRCFTAVTARRSSRRCSSARWRRYGWRRRFVPPCGGCVRSKGRSRRTVSSRRRAARRRASRR